MQHFIWIVRKYPLACRHHSSHYKQPTSFKKLQYIFQWIFEKWNIAFSGYFKSICLYFINLKIAVTPYVKKETGIKLERELNFLHIYRSPSFLYLPNICEEYCVHFITEYYQGQPLISRVQIVIRREEKYKRVQ